MSVSKEHASPQAVFGREALRRLRERQGANSQAGTPGPEPEPPPTAVSPPAPLPSGVGFAVVVPLPMEGVRLACPHSVEEAMRIPPGDLPETLTIHGEHRVEFWYLLAQPPTTPADTELAEETAWRVRMWFGFKAGANGWVVAKEHCGIQAFPTDSNGVVRRQACISGYTIADLNARLDQAGIPIREQYEREAAEWQERFRCPELITVPDDLVIDADAVLPDTVLQPLLNRDPAFRATWLHERSDLPDRVEAYEKELTRILADHKFEAQQIVDGIIHWRRSHGMKPELRMRQFRQLLSQEWRGTAEPIKGTPRQKTARRDRRQLCVAANDAEQAIFEEWAQREGQTISNLIRLKFGMPPTYAGRPDADQEGRREDWIWETLKNLGIDPTPFLPEV